MRFFAAILILCSLASVAIAQMGANLFQPSAATDTAAQSGSWQDAATWADGTVPAAGEAVYIPPGVTVTNHATIADVAWIHVAGTLSACSHCDTQLNVGTLYVPMGGEIDIQATGQCTIEFIDSSTHNGDWQKLAGGLISHGRVRIQGLEKTAWSEIADAELAGGAVTLTLPNVPVRWQVGDKIIIAGTDSKIGETNVKYQSEFRTIAAINGTTVTLDAPLVYRHFRWAADLKFHVANLSRNVVIRSRETETPRRGHLMFMSSDVDLRYVEIDDCGRTNKSQDVTDPQLDQDGNLIAGTDANPRARYACHWHRVGQLSAPASVRGCVVNGSPGWGFLIHNSNAHIDDCVAVRCNGFGFGTEEGQERGHFRRCLSAMNHGLGDVVTSTDSDHGRMPIGDWGKDGSGFWLQGGMVEVSDCVSFDNSGRGFALFNRTLNSFPDYSDVPSLPSLLKYPITIDPTLLSEEYATVSSPVTSSAVPQQVFDRNTAYGNKVGLQAWSLTTPKRMPVTMRGSIRDLTLWGRGAGLHLEYVRQMNIDGLTVIGDLGVRPSGPSIQTVPPILLRGPMIDVRRLSIGGSKTTILDIGTPAERSTHSIDGTWPIRDVNGQYLRGGPIQ